ncbi:hypothetical protein ACFU96_27255 [Streptomyces sp. NPDC057620]|uniref:hypothetical protein n=1 Tax=Streptomyces sp. NPDC057620 TaxID=3346185 RepID=UPI0036A52316
MSALPEQYQRFAPPGPRPTYPATVELRDEHDPIVYIPDAYGQLVPMRKSQAPQPMPRPEPRDLTPQPLFDPLAQRMVGGGIGAGAAGAGLGWGFGQAAAGIATIGGTTMVVAMLALYLIARAGRPSVRVEQTVHQHASWFSTNRVEM